MPQKQFYAQNRQQPFTNSQFHSAALMRLPGSNGDSIGEGSNSGWSVLMPYVIGKQSLYPMTDTMRQRLILQYLNQVAACQDLLQVAFEKNVLATLYDYIDLHKNNDVRLAFDALRCLGSLCVHRKFALELVNGGGIVRLTDVYRQSMASAGVAYVLSYLCLIEDVLEKMCVLPANHIEQLIDYALWLLEHSYETGRGYACLFFERAFRFQPFIELFDQRDGLRKLYNYISTLAIMQPDSHVELGEEQEAQSRHAIHAVVTALKTYFVSHLYIKVELLKRLGRHMGQYHHPMKVRVPSFPPGQTPRGKAMHMDVTSINECVTWLLHVLPTHTVWRPVDELRRLHVVHALLYICNEFSESNWTQKADTVRATLDVLHICTVLPRVQLDLLHLVQLTQSIKSDGINILLTLCEGVALQCADVQRAALHVLINCVCAPEWRVDSNTMMFQGSNKRTRKLSGAVGGDAVDTLHKMWDAVRRNNGIMVLRWLLFLRSPITDADSLRALACRALDGMCRSKEIAMMLAKMSMIVQNELQSLMREPVCTDRRAEHHQFCESVLSLMEKATGRSYPLMKDLPSDLSIDSILRASVVAQTKIVYNETELLQLIYLHLKKKGLNKAAVTLYQEAELPNVPASTVVNTPEKIGPLPSRRHALTSNGHQSTSTSSTTINHHHNTTHHNNNHVIPFSSGQTHRSLALRAGPHSMIGGISAYLRRRGSQTQLNQQRSAPTTTPVSKNKHLRNVIRSPIRDKPIKPAMELDELVLNHFRKQHAQCANPVSACPPFSLFYHHRCPELHLTRTAPFNFSARVSHRQLQPPHGGIGGSRCDRQLLYSRFRPMRVLKDADQPETFTCCQFTRDDSLLMCGTYAGDLKVYSVATGDEEGNVTLHPSAVTSVQQSTDQRTLLTSSAYVRPLSTLWKYPDSTQIDTLDKLHDFENQYYLEYCNAAAPDRLVGTNGHRATVFDLTTAQSVVELYDTDRSNYYTRNRAMFHPYDSNMILNDGLLFDIRSPQQLVHKFDKLNSNIPGVFHPRGLQIIINTEVWDARTYRLLYTVPSLDQCKLAFSSSGDIILAVVQPPDDDDQDQNEQLWLRSFRSLDATDYSLITTVDARNQLADIAIDNQHDSWCAVIENRGGIDDLNNLDENIVRLYEIGRRREEDEEDDDANEQGEGEEEYEDDDDDDDDDASAATVEILDDALEVIEDDDNDEDDSGSEDDDEDDDDDENDDEEMDAEEEEEEEDEDYNPDADASSVAESSASE